MVTIIESASSKLLKEQNKKSRRDCEVANKFNEYYKTSWKPDMYYVPSDFIEVFNIDRHRARYHLMNLVYEKKVFRIRYSNKTFYIRYT